MYSCAQLVVHGDSLSPERSQTLGFPSLAICVNAARSLAHVLHVTYHRGMLDQLLPWCTTQVLSAAMLLLIK